jgi:flavin reductase
MSRMDPEALRGSFIAAMRRVAASVTVVTTEGPAGRHGATVSAFSSLSADPPMVLVCLHSDSRIARLVAENGCYTVNVLPEGSSDLAARFASADAQDRFAGLAVQNSATGPELPGAAVLHCRLHDQLAYGSHMLAIGAVQQARSSAAAPLTYLDGQFCRLSPCDPQKTDPTEKDQNRCQSSA